MVGNYKLKYVHFRFMRIWLMMLEEGFSYAEIAKIFDKKRQNVRASILNWNKKHG